MGEPTEIDVPAIKARLLAKMGEHAASYPVQIEQRFPHVLARLAELWGTRDADRYLDSLMVSDRPNRAGFPPDVAMEIFRLATAHGSYGLSTAASGTGWAGVDEAALAKKAFSDQR
ncbi:hypothetical protein [Azospira restricta]|uniref:Uncharacterized protein n=1 Tax=Azospira restricta TaxID=404405 RepID=A0A974SQ38_9RHOO|nr:hypothetical protein [Azospira restricta]QRJ64392.1 hypothetical protein IWH25_03300 [Azospira restricta]